MTYDVIGRVPGFWVLVAQNVPSEQLGSVMDRHLRKIDPLTGAVIQSTFGRYEKLEVHGHPTTFNLTSFLDAETEIYDNQGRMILARIGGRGP